MDEKGQRQYVKLCTDNELHIFYLHIVYFLAHI